MQGEESPLLTLALLHAPVQGVHGGKYHLLELTTSLAKQWLSYASVDRIAPVPKEPMARRLMVNKVIESTLDPSYDGESGIEDPSFPLPIGILHSDDETCSLPHKREFTTRTLSIPTPRPQHCSFQHYPRPTRHGFEFVLSPQPAPCELLYESADRTRTYIHGRLHMHTQTPRS